MHGLVQWSDGALTAGLAPPDMKIPIANALRHHGGVSNAAANVSILPRSRD